MFWKKRTEQPAAAATDPMSSAPPIEAAAPVDEPPMVEQPTEPVIEESPVVEATDSDVAETTVADVEEETVADVAEATVADTAETDGADAWAEHVGRAQLEARIIEAISEVYDPEIPVNIYELGLIYDLNITADNCVRVDMTLTSPACPVAGTLPGEVETMVRSVEGVQDVALELVWDPPWTPDRMSEAARLELGFM